MVYLNKPVLVVKIGINADIYLSHSGSWNSVTQYSAVLCMILCSKYNFFFFIHRHFQRVSAAQCFTAGNVHVSTHYWKNVQNAKDILRFQYHTCIYANTHTHPGKLVLNTTCSFSSPRTELRWDVTC